MTKRFPGRWAAVVLSLMAGVVWVIRDDVDSDAAAGRRPVEAGPHRPPPLQTAVKEPLFASESRLNLKPLQDAAKRFLTDRGRSAENLAVAFMMSREAAYLEEALVKEPNSLAALYVRIGARALGPRPDLVQRLRTLEPQNPLWCVEEALVSVRGGDTSRATATLRTALTLDSLNDPFPSFLAAEEAFRRDYLHESYRDSMAAARLARTGTLACDFYLVHHHLLSEVRAAHVSGLAGKASECAALGLSVALLEARQRSLDGLRRGSTQEDQILRVVAKELSGNQLLDRPFNQYRQEAIADVRLAGRLGVFRDEYIETASEDELRQYVAARTKVGEVAALQALLAKSGATVMSE